MKPVSDIKSFIFNALIDDQRSIAAILAADKRATEGREFYDDGYYDAFAKNGALQIAEERFNASASGVVSVWARGLNEAGKPSSCPKTARARRVRIRKSSARSADMQLFELAKLLGFAHSEGTGHADVRRVTGLEDAQPGDVTFLWNRKYAKHVAKTCASAIIADASLTSAPCPIIRSANPYVTFAQALAGTSRRPPASPGVSALAAIDATASIGTGGASIAAVRQHRARCGDRRPLRAVSARDRGSRHGHRRRLRHSRARVDSRGRRDRRPCGAPGRRGDRQATALDSRKRPDGSHQKIPQVGRVVIEHDVEIGAHSAVDPSRRAARRASPPARRSTISCRWRTA